MVKLVLPKNLEEIMKAMHANDRMRTADEVLVDLLDSIIVKLEAIKCGEITGDENFIRGEKVAFIECLESIKKWEKAREVGFNFNVKERFPLE